ncbi:Uncharacterised protein [uncultured archaeon]|nr:Uncharacterised protein [uncultured archaeon]
MGLKDVNVYEGDHRGVNISLDSREFSDVERRDLMEAGLVLAVAFVVFFTHGSVDVGTIATVVCVVFAVFMGLLFKEAGQKNMARHNHNESEQTVDKRLFFLPLLTSLTGFLPYGFVAAAVGRVRLRHEAEGNLIGEVAAAGAAANLFLAGIFLIFYLTPLTLVRDPADVFVSVNASLALMTLLPAPLGDGTAVGRWNRGRHLLMIAIAVVMLLL